MYNARHKGTVDLDSEQKYFQTDFRKTVNLKRNNQVIDQTIRIIP